MEILLVGAAGRPGPSAIALVAASNGTIARSDFPQGSGRRLDVGWRPDPIKVAD
jgi:hypothetical protein